MVTRMVMSPASIFCTVRGFRSASVARAFPFGSAQGLELVETAARDPKRSQLGKAVSQFLRQPARGALAAQVRAGRADESCFCGAGGHGAATFAAEFAGSRLEKAHRAARRGCGRCGRVPRRRPSASALRSWQSCRVRCPNPSTGICFLRQPRLLTLTPDVPAQGFELLL